MKGKFVSPYADIINPQKAKSNRVRFEFVMDSITDADIIKKLNECPVKADYIRSLIRADLAKK